MKAICLALALTAASVGVSRLCAVEPAPRLLPLYEKVSGALVADNLTDAHAAARTLAAVAVAAHQAEVAAAAATVAKAKDLAATREAFKQLSKDAVQLARRERGWFIVNCPMADADWVQSTRQIANPYFGQAMPTCGTVTEETKG